MRILIADDSHDKQEMIHSFISKKYPTSEFIRTYSFNSTREQILTSSFSLILLDMTMPSFDPNDKNTGFGESRNRPLAGKEIISSMAYREINTPVIIVTQFEVFGRHNQLTSIDDVFEEINGLYPNIVKGTVLFDFQSESWKTKLDKLINGIFL
ncbi:hypothetical protein [Pantoea agglomerans]|uniref:hypothetical protein n=1 Tax=Enterobacter agglomerans TaxID=549 RepID=UPI003C7B38C3